MKRRKFILGTGAAVTLVSVGAFTYWYNHDDLGPVVLNPLIQDFLSDDDLLGIINDYQERSDENTALKVHPLEKVLTMIKEDFEKDGIVISDGWILSKTEVKYLIQKEGNEPDA